MGGEIEITIAGVGSGPDDPVEDDRTERKMRRLKRGAQGAQRDYRTGIEAYRDLGGMSSTHESNEARDSVGGAIRKVSDRYGKIRGAARKLKARYGGR